MDLKKRKKLVISGAVFVAVVLILAVGFYFYEPEAALNSNTSQQNTSQGEGVTIKWVSYNDEHGFAVQKPENWKAQVNNWGLIQIGPDPEKSGEQTVFALTMVYPVEKTKEQVLEDVKKNFEKSFTNFEVSNTKNIDAYNSTVCKITYTGSDMTGILNVTGDGKSFFVSGFASPRDQLENNMPDLMKTLASFTYDASLKNPAKVGTAVTLVPWADPNESAFTLHVPSDWTIEGGLVRPYIDAGIKIVATSGDMGIQIENVYPPIYSIPNQVLEFAGFTEGSHYNPSGGISQDMIVMSEKNAEQYIRTVLAEDLNLTVDSVASRSDLVEITPKPSYVTQTTAAEGTLIGDGKIHKVIVIEQGMGMSGVGMWTVALTHYWAPEGDIKKVEKIATAMGESFVVDPTWAKNEQIEIAKRSNIISQTGSEISDIITSTFEYRSSTQDETAHDWSNAILGVQDVYDPSTGENYSVPNTSTYYWTDGLNTVVGTDTHDSPGYYWDWKELIPAE